MIQIVKCGPADIALGGACAWQLPQDATCARHARSLIKGTLTALSLEGLIDAVTLSISELVTNALQHAEVSSPYGPITPIELWIWARATPEPALNIGVFDPCRTAWPQTPSGADRWGDPAVDDGLPDERGRGLGIVSALAQAWGAHLTRSRLGPWRVPGKVVWAAFPLPGPWPDVGLSLAPSATAHYLADVLSVRGVERVGRRDERGVSLVSVPLTGSGSLNIWVGPTSVSLTDTDGTRLHRPLVDLQDVTEHLVRRIEERATA